MPKIDESEVQRLQDEIKRLEKRLNDRDEQSEKESSIWSIPLRWRGRFYSVLSICGIAVSIFTVLTLCKKQNTSWIKIFDALWNLMF